MPKKKMATAHLVWGSFSSLKEATTRKLVKEREGYKNVKIKSKKGKNGMRHTVVSC